MNVDPTGINALREALAFSPENLPLRRHLVEKLFELGRLEEAERETMAGLKQAPDEVELKLLLVRAYHLQNKISHAMVVIEDVLASPDCPPQAHVIESRLLLAEGRVEEAVDRYKTALQLDPSLEDEGLSERLGVSVDPESEPDEYQEVFEGRVRQMADVEGDPFTEIEKPSTNFSDVGGLSAMKEEISLKIIYPLKHQDMYAAYGKKIGGGILLYGPPGCGKTFLARATAGEIEASFVSVGISEILDMWTGATERNLSGIFQSARANRPCVLFFDEVDALGARRSDMKGAHARQSINTFLAELDGVEDNNDGLLVLGATNAPWHMDPAFRRPGRFDRVIFVPPPDLEGRVAIMQLLLNGKPTKDVDLEQVARKADRFSGADLKGVVDMAVEAKLQAAMKTGVPEPITTRDLTAALKRLKPTTQEWFATARNHATYANEGGLYDDVLNYLKK